MQHPLDRPSIKPAHAVGGIAKEKGISDGVIAALEFVPRHWFMDAGLVAHAYKNKAYPIAPNKPSRTPIPLHFSRN